jgi:hypothetical protein
MYTFQAYSVAELTRIKYLLDSCRQFTAPIINIGANDLQSDSAQVIITQNSSMMVFLNQQANWKRTVANMISGDDALRPSFTTIKLEATGLRALRGVVIQPPVILSKDKKSTSPISSPKHSPKDKKSTSPISSPKHSRFRNPISTFDSIRRDSLASSMPSYLLPSGRDEGHIQKNCMSPISAQIEAQIEALDREIALLSSNSQRNRYD